MTPDPSLEAGSDVPSERIYTPAPGELQLTLRSMVVASLIGTLLATINVYFGLKTGWTIGGSILAAILSYALFAVLRPRHPFTVLETNIAQTAASATGTMTTAAGLVAPIPALMLMGRDGASTFDLGLGPLITWSAAVAWIGVFFAVPLRRQMVLVEKLRFPSGTATAHTIVAMFGSGAETLRRARALLVWAGITAGFVLLCWAVKPIKEPQLATWVGGVFATLATYTFTLYLDPLLIGAGILVGMRVSLSLVAGAVLAWGVLAPLVRDAGWAPGAVMSYKDGARGWILWTGVAIMLGEALTSLALSWRTIVAVFRPGRGAAAGLIEDPREGIPAAWWMGGLMVSAVCACVVLGRQFQIPVWQTLIALGLSSVLAAIAVRSVGETDINPVSGVAKVTQFAFGALAPGQVATNLLAGGVTGSGASQAADMMGDLKTGHLLGASPRKQFIAQVIGVGVGVLVAAPVFLLVTQNGALIGSKDLPAPSAFAWKATAELLAVGLKALPPHAEWGALAGALFGIAIPLLKRFAPRTERFLPSAMAMGIAFIIPAFYALPFLMGAIAHLVWKRRAPAQAADLAFAVASGILVGAGLLSVGTSILDALGVPPLVGLPH